MSYTVFPRISAYALVSALPRISVHPLGQNMKQAPSPPPPSRCLIVVVYKLLLLLNEYRDRLPLFKDFKNFYNIKNQTVRFDLLQVPFQRNDLE